MINFYVNGQKQDIQIEDEKTVGEVLTAFEQTCEQNKAAVIGITIDGKQITAEFFDEEAKKELTDNMTFEFTMVTEASVKYSFQELSSLFSDLSVKMENIPMEMQNGNNLTAIESIKVLAESIDNFCHVAALASLFPETYSKTAIGEKNFMEFLKEFSPILQDFEEALKNNDTVLIGDLSEYEICPRLKEISESLK